MRYLNIALPGIFSTLFNLFFEEVFGSNIFNTLLVVGTAGATRPFEIAARLAGVDYWIMIVVSIAFATAALLSKRVITRTAGALLLCAYAAFLFYVLTFTG